MAAAKKAVKKTVKKAAKKTVAKVATKKTKVAAAVAQILTPDVDLARRILAHDAVNRGNLRVDDMFRVRSDDRAGTNPGAPMDEWDSVSDEYVTFKGINQHGLLVVEYDTDDYVIPVEAVNWGRIEENEGQTVKLNGDYEAYLGRVFDEDLVEVGCQEIKVDVIEALYKRIQAIKSGDVDAEPSRELTLAPGGLYTELVFVAK